MNESQLTFFKSFFGIESEQEISKAMDRMSNSELQEFMKSMACIPEIIKTLEVISRLDLD